MPAASPLHDRGPVVTKAQALADRLTTAIAVGAYSPGDRLPSERDLAELMGVSRVTVREAIRLVSGLGLLASVRGREGGTFVTEADWTTVAPDVALRTLESELPALREFCEYRCLVEATIARTAAERCTEADAELLRERLTQFDSAADSSAARSADDRLHREIAAVARNERLSVLSVELSREATLGFGSEPYPDEFLSTARREHHALVEAVIERDTARAFDVARQHYGLTLEILEAGLSKARATTS
ncbi:FCD domain-containing protein [Nocardioides panacis]|uniref:FCD domain-containing protein n=1 Tax=Nocardioides panacis TaxID=2849501 RepID=A0A975Y006_9ACTN|nr:FCD domain-containing protein [Nocardioides panacis]QWZ07819.1 FCD domain-containing protein [Nocardioides panacis]